jgi:hypothetical protein
VKIKNETVLKTIMLNQMKSVMDMVVDEILESLKKNIDKKVYNSFSPSKNGYQRLGDNGGLRDLWEEEEAKIKNGKVIGEVKEKPERLVLNEDLFQHGSRFWYQNDIRDMIAYIVIEGKSGDLFGEGKWRKPRDFWHPLIDKLDAGQINQIIEKAFRKHKIKFIRVY